MILMRYFFSLFLLVSMAYADVPCPFNQRCRCEGVDETPGVTTIRSVHCSDIPNLVFTPPKNETYIVTLEFFIRAPVDKIPSSTFSAFQFIRNLYLIQPRQLQDNAANWDYEAFHGTQVVSLTTEGLKEVLPPQNALKRLGGNGLKELNILGLLANGDHVKLSQDVFAGFKSLKVLVISFPQISSIHPRAFNGLDSLSTLHLGNSKRWSFDLSVLDGLNDLTELRLQDTSSLELIVSNVDQVRQPATI